MSEENAPQQPAPPKPQAPRAPAQPKPQASPTVAALRSTSTLVLTLASALQHRSVNGEAQPPEALEVCQAALGEGEEVKARLVSEVKYMRLRQGDEIVVCSPERNGSKLKLSTPIKIDDHWDPALDGGAGAVISSSFFRELAKRAHPLCCKRRTDENGTFWIDWA